MDSLYIDRIELWTRIGVPEEERRAEQRILVSIELFGDLCPVGTSDDVGKGIDYEHVVNDVCILSKNDRKTIENLAEDVASMILRKYKPQSVKVSVWKDPLPAVKGIAATIERSA